MAAAVWSFRAGRRGLLWLRLHPGAGSAAALFSLTDHFSVPFDDEAELESVFSLRLSGSSGLAPGRAWSSGGTSTPAAVASGSTVPRSGCCSRGDVSPRAHRTCGCAFPPPTRSTRTASASSAPGKWNGQSHYDTRVTARVPRRWLTACQNAATASGFPSKKSSKKPTPLSGGG